MSAPKRGFIAHGDPNVHAEKSGSLWFLSAYCGVRAEVRTAQSIGIFRVTSGATLCGACVCEIETEATTRENVRGHRLPARSER